MAAGADYLRERKGRWLVQVPVPKHLKGAIKGKTNIALTNVEKYLGTASKTEAKLLAPAAVAEIRAQFRRAQEHRPLSPEEIRYEALKELHFLFNVRASDPFESWSEKLNDWLQTLVIGNGELIDYEQVRSRAVAIINRNRATPTEESIKLLSEELVSAAFSAKEMWEKNLSPPPLKESRARRTSNDEQLSKVTESYLHERQRDRRARLTEQTAAQMKTTFRLFIDQTNDEEVGNISRKQAGVFLDTIAKLHRHYGRSPDAKALRLQELVKSYPADHNNGLTNKTINRHQSTLHAFFKWARKRDFYEGENPFADLAREKARASKTVWLPFNTDEITRLFANLVFEIAPKVHTAETARPWIMAIAIFSGMRLGEICDLNPDDIKSENNIYYFDIVGSKSEAGERRVPIHSRLINLGLLKYVTTIDSGPIFPGLKPGGRDKKRGHYFSRRFTVFRRQRNVNRPRLTFHSFRKCFVRALELGQVTQNRAAQIVGHERDFTFGTYNPEGLDMVTLKEIVETVQFNFLHLGAHS